MKKILLLLMVLASLSSIAQTTVSGIVKDDEGAPLGYVTVLVKGTTTGAFTDDDGKFTLTLPEGSTTLVVSYTGLPTKEVEIAGKTTFEIQMDKAGLDLNPVVISASKKQEKLLEAPASIDVIPAKEIQAKVSTSPTDYISDVAGVDIMKTGLAQSNVVLRGFNNIFSGSALTLVDYRIGSIPSLRVNVNQLMPGNYLDIERVEVLKGPASALYGPNAANGAIHFITKSPLDEAKDFTTTISLGGGERNTLTGQLRHTGKVKKSTEKSPLQIGYRISGQYMQAHDWTYYDPAEHTDEVPVFGKQTPNGKVYTYSDGTEISDTLVAQGIRDTVPERNNFLQNYNMDGRLDFRFSRHLELVLSGGYSNASGIELTGLGAGQARNWSYNYGQARLRWKNLFVQGYVNASDAGDTYLIRSGNLIVDKSKFYVGQIQHSYSTGKFRFIYGGDAQMTRPDTEGTINGRNEDSDNIDIYGGYVQGEHETNEWLKFVAAMRVDYNTSVKKPTVSPRAAAVIKPYPGHNIRLTYNRAFSSPSALTNSLDIMEREDPFGIGGLIATVPTGYDVRALGNGNGFTFNRTDDGFLQLRSPFATLPAIGKTPQDYFSLGDADYFTSMWGLTQAIFLGSYLGSDVPTSAVLGISNALLSQMPDGIGTALIPLNLEREGFFQEDAVNPDDIQNIEPVGNQITSTYEIGYNGIIAERMVFKADMYRSDISDFVSPLLIQTPNVFFDYQDVYNALSELVANSNDPNLASYLQALDQSEDGNSNGDGIEEVAALVSGIPLGTVSPEEANDPSVLLTYRNFGNITVYGFDLEAIYYLTEDFKFGATYSFVNKDQFESEGQIIALNAPANKVNLTTQYNIKKIGLNVGLRWRWQDAFPANSGVYVGNVPALNQLDVSLDYTLPFSKMTHLSVTVQNAYNYQIKEFVGVPTMGRLTLFRLSHTF